MLTFSNSTAVESWHTLLMQVSRQVDELVEREFNRLLDASAYLACERGIGEQLRAEHGINVSLGETLFALFRCALLIL